MKYEYKIVKIAKQLIYKSPNDNIVNADKVEEFENNLNELGKDGWNLVEIVQPQGFLGLGDIGLCIFKREKKEK